MVDTGVDTRIGDLPDQEEDGCLCMTGCEDIRLNPNIAVGSGIDMCCDDWADVALEHCQQGKT